MTWVPLLVAVLGFFAVLGAARLTQARAAPRVAANGAGVARGIWLETHADSQASRALTSRLLLAGFERRDAARAFRIARVACTMACIVLGFQAGRTLAAEPTAAFYGALLGALIGWRLPSWWLDRRADESRMEIRADFPVMLDLLQISMQGGMGLHAAWSATAESLGGAGDALAREMRRVDLAVGLGGAWGRALEEAAERSGVDEFRSLGALLGQTQRFGTGVADMIRVLCDSLRHDEVQALEEQAHRRTVRMLTVLTGVLLPATLMIIFFPLLRIIADSLSPLTTD
ncbi:MAG: type II secretion system F family protein [Planctomycetota bacterium]